MLYEKSMHGTDFLHKLQQYKGLKLTTIIFLEKILYWRFWARAQNEIFAFACKTKSFPITTFSFPPF